MLVKVSPYAVLYRAEFDEKNGREMARGEVGEIWAGGPNVMLGYVNKPDETAQILVGGWMRTGDAGYMDDDGFIYLVDRIKDMIITGGENVASLEVENIITAHPAISVCAVFGLPDEYWGEAVHAVVVPKPAMEVTEAEIIAHCKNSLAGYKFPTSVDVRTEPLRLSGPAKAKR